MKTTATKSQVQQAIDNVNKKPCKTNEMKRTGLYYLNNTGHRWVIFDETGRREQRTFETKRGAKIVRRVNFYEAFGNFATCNINYKRKRINVFADTLLDD